MAIFGIGCDLVKHERIARALTCYGLRFVRRILTPNEREQWQAQVHKVAFLAKRFAAKEACVKALGTGFTSYISFQDIEVIKDEGPPALLLQGVAGRIAQDRGCSHWHLSLSDEKDYSLAFVVASQ